MTSTNNTAYFVLHDLVCESMPLDSPLLSIHAGTTLLYCPDTDQQGSEYFYATLKGNHSTYNFSNNTLSLRIQLVVQWSAQRNTMPLPPARFTFITCLHTLNPSLMEASPQPIELSKWFIRYMSQSHSMQFSCIQDGLCRSFSCIIRSSIHIILSRINSLHKSIMLSLYFF